MSQWRSADENRRLAAISSMALDMTLAPKLDGSGNPDWNDLKLHFQPEFRL
jgi:hypothetical protein